MRVSRRVVVAVVGLAATVQLLGACSDGAGSGGSGAREQVQVFAAASLTDVFADIEEAFERTRPDIDVAVSVAGSSSLREQVLDGAPADVVATANNSVMDTLVEAGAVVGPVDFASNRLVLAVPIGNPGNVEGLGALERSDLLIGWCAAGVPCGDLAREWMASAGIDIRPDTEEANVRAVLAKLELGELDAGLVYATDVLASDEVDAVPTDPATGSPRSTYPMALVGDSPESGAAADFTRFVGSAEGQQILAEHGFGPP